MADRTTSNQTKHDKEVKRIADDYKDREYTVQADLKDYPLPESIGGYRPDVRAQLKNIEYEVAVEVETTDSLDSDHAKKQDAAFKKWQSQEPSNRRYWPTVVY